VGPVHDSKAVRADHRGVRRRDPRRGRFSTCRRRAGGRGAPRDRPRHRGRGIGLMGAGWVERIWYGDDAVATAGRAALWPFSRLFEAITSARHALYAAGALRVETPVLPVISVGNLTVGGTGKTPVASWLAGRLSMHAVPAIVLRGYGNDEVEVHRLLNPHIPVVVGVDRAAAIREAKSRDTDVVVLDDAFQHRRVARTADVVLLSAEQLLRSRRLLPAGPWREPLTASRRADLLVVTRKSADASRARDALAVTRAVAPGVPVALIHLRLHALVSTSGARETLPLDRLRGVRVLAIAAIGEPSAFREQLEQSGARVTLAAYRDHHLFSDEEVRALVARVPPDGLAVC